MAIAFRAAVPFGTLVSHSPVRIQEEIMPNNTKGKVNAIPEGYHSVTPYLSVKGAAAAIDFYKKAFGATEIMRMPAPGGLIGHAEFKIGNSILMIADETPDMGNKSPASLGGTPITLLIYVEN